MAIGLLGIILIVALVTYLVAQFVPMPARLGTVALCVWLVTASLMLLGVDINA